MERSTRWQVAAWCLSGWLGSHTAWGGTDKPAPPAPVPPHIEVEHSLGAILQEKQQILDEVRTNDLAHLREGLARIQEQLRQSRLEMDRALLVGAWHGASEKKKGAQVIETMQELEILSLMGVAISSGYDYPTQKVPVAVADSTGRLFDLLERAHAEVVVLNQGLHE